MTSVPDEMLMAYADGELAPEEATVLEAHLAQDASLRARLAPFILTRTRLASVFEPTLHEPVPERLIAAVTRTPAAGRAQSGHLAAAERIRDAVMAFAAAAFPHGLSLATAASVAGILAVGAAGGWLLGRAGTPSDVFAVAGESVVATGSLAHALESEPSRHVRDAYAEGATVVPVLSFRTESNGLCRAYRVRGDAAASDLAGLACRTPEGIWRVVLNVETPPVPPSDPDTGYETATGDPGVPAVEAHIDTIIAGSALNPDEESAIRESGWDIPPAGG